MLSNFELTLPCAMTNFRSQFKPDKKGHFYSMVSKENHVLKYILPLI